VTSSAEEKTHAETVTGGTMTEATPIFDRTSVSPGMTTARPKGGSQTRLKDPNAYLHC
jgi:hypothetical protein